MKALLLLASLFTLALPVVAQAVNVNIVSDSTWTVSDTNGNDLGNAQNVCLNATVPSNCPAAATRYGYAFPGWTATIPGATWIWAPNITAATASAANAEFTFQKQFFLCHVPTSGTISLAADDFAEVFLNGTSVGRSTSHSTLSTFPVSAPQLRYGVTIAYYGLNIIQVKARNGPNPSDCRSGQYRCNPAGVILEASFADSANAWPTCPGTRGTTAGQFEVSSCPAGQMGSDSRLCICGPDGGLWQSFRTCVTPPTTCTGISGTPFAVGMPEPVACPLGQTGSASRICQPDGSWGPTDFSTCLPPVAAGAICGSRDQGVTRTCPAGTTCGPRSRPVPPRPWWCIFFNFLPGAPSECRPDRTRTADWFCDP